MTIYINFINTHANYLIVTSHEHHLAAVDLPLSAFPPRLPLCPNVPQSVVRMSHKRLSGCPTNGCPNVPQSVVRMSHNRLSEYPTNGCPNVPQTVVRMSHNRLSECPTNGCPNVPQTVVRMSQVYPECPRNVRLPFVSACLIYPFPSFGYLLHSCRVLFPISLSVSLSPLSKTKKNKTKT